MIQVLENVVLNPLSEKDIPDIFNTLNNEREYMRVWLPFVDYTYEENDTRNFVISNLGTVDKHFTISYKETFVGLIGFKDTDPLNRKTEIGYWLSQQAQGKGIMVHSVLKLIEYAFSEMDMNRIQIKVAVNNHRSKQIPEKLGFLLEGVERDGELLVDNVYTDINVYSLLKKEFKGKSCK
ncbi:MAG: GNAT family N-acetyltransferase [Prevotella sp.]|jgi:ribosomal-protein-serine acetyltransferase|nr:GNAT family N-acetyltransferase [Prevotella sp.]